MREVVAELARRVAAGERCALATVVATTGSAPRPPGTALVVGADGSVVGSVSSGCVEAAVHEVGLGVLAGDGPSRHSYGGPSGGHEAAPTCGGVLDVLVQPVDAAHWPDLADLAAALDAGTPVALAVVVTHPDADLVGRHAVLGAGGAAEDPDPDPGAGLGRPGLLAAVRRHLREPADDRPPGGQPEAATLLGCGPDGEPGGRGAQVLVHTFRPAPRLLVFGASDFAGALSRVGAVLGYRVTVCDARALFATPERLPGAAEVVVDQPHRYLAAEARAGRVDGRTAVVVCTHEPRFDVPLLQEALALDLAFVGAMGSRGAHDDRVARLRGVGVDDAALARLSSPVGLDLGARTPEETAVSIAAEIVALRRAGTGRRLRDLDGRLHR